MVLQWAARSMALAKREAVLSIALLLAVVSACFVPPSAAYFGYIDWNTLALLFSLMVVMKGYQRAGVFLCLANGLLRRVRSTRALLGVLVFLPFGLSMVVTNDVALLTVGAAYGRAGAAGGAPGGDADFGSQPGQHAYPHG